MRRSLECDLGVFVQSSARRRQAQHSDRGVVSAEGVGDLKWRTPDIAPMSCCGSLCSDDIWPQFPTLVSYLVVALKVCSMSKAWFCDCEECCLFHRYCNMIFSFIVTQKWACTSSAACTVLRLELGEKMPPLACKNYYIITKLAMVPQMRDADLGQSCHSFPCC